MFFLRSIIFLILFSISAATASAASIYLEPQSGSYAQGTSFSIKVRVDNQNECINAGSFVLEYPNTSIRAIDVVRGESIFTLWTEDPVIDHENGHVRFSGGIPGGYCGRIEGDPGLTNVIAEVIFQVPGFTIGERGPDTGAVILGEDTTILLNDGRGTPAELVKGTSVFNIVPPGQGETNFDWFREVSEDTIKPEPFSIELIRDESVWDGRWFIVFNTLDKQSGIDHFEVYETDIKNEGFVHGKRDVASIWKDARSPYLLEDQSLNSVIRVRAFDKAGNDRIAGFVPDETLRETTREPLSKELFYIVLSLIGILAVGGIVFLMYRKLSKKTKEERDTMLQNGTAQSGGENILPESDQRDENEGYDTETQTTHSPD